MHSFNDPLMMRQIIMDHYEHPRNKRTPVHLNYRHVHMDSASCIDDIHLYVLMQGDFISDICFDGIGCAISTASTSILTELIMGKTRKEALHIIQQYEAMIFEQPYEEDSLEEAVVFRNTSKQANRIKCATIGWDGLKRLLHE